MNVALLLLLCTDFVKAKLNCYLILTCLNYLCTAACLLFMLKHITSNECIYSENKAPLESFTANFTLRVTIYVYFEARYLHNVMR